MKDYQRETIAMIRAASPRLNGKSDESIAAMYGRWSEQTRSAGWLLADATAIAEFVSWATKAPCDSYNDANPAEPRQVALRIVEHGAVRVSWAYVHRDADGIVCIYVVLHTKYAEAGTPLVGNENTPAVLLEAGEQSKNLDESKPRDSLTIVQFPEYTGWRVFAIDGPARYTLGVVLVAPEKSA